MVFLKHECEPKTIKMKNNNPETFVWLDLKIDQVFHLFLKPKMAKWFQLLKCETLPLFPVFYHSKLSIFGFRYNNWFPSSDPFLLPFRAFSTSALSLVFVSVFLFPVPSLFWHGTGLSAHRQQLAGWRTEIHDCFLFIIFPAYGFVFTFMVKITHYWIHYFFFTFTSHWA